MTAAESYVDTLNVTNLMIDGAARITNTKHTRTTGFDKRPIGCQLPLQCSLHPQLTAQQLPKTPPDAQTQLNDNVQASNRHDYRQGECREEISFHRMVATLQTQNLLSLLNGADH